MHRAAAAGLLMALATLAPLALVSPALPAGAQVAPLTGAIVEVTWTWDPPEPAVRQGTTTPMQGTAHVVVRETVCALESEVAVQLALRGADEASEAAGIHTDPQPLAFTFPLRAGAHGAGPASPFEVDVPVGFQLLLPQTAAPGTYGLVGENLVPADPPGCVRTELFGDGGTAPAGPTAGFTMHVLPAERPEEAHPGHETHGGVTFDLSLHPGERANHTFTVTGTFPYHDHLKPDQRGTVVVGAGHPASAEVRITPSGFEPAEVRVRAGGVVTWINEDDERRQVSADETHPEHGDHDDHQASPPGSPPPSGGDSREPELGDDDPPIDFTSEEGGEGDRGLPGPAAALALLAIAGCAAAARPGLGCRRLR